MSRQPIQPTDVSDPASGKFPLDFSDWPQFKSLEQAEEAIPRLHTPGAQTIARDRWERLVTRVEISAAPEEVWGALTDPTALKQWFAVCHGALSHLQSDCVLDFEDGEFFLCRPTAVHPPDHLQYLWRWLGIGQATSVTWNLEGTAGGTHLTVIEEAQNPPWDWQTWNGGGWPRLLGGGDASCEIDVWRSTNSRWAA